MALFFIGLLILIIGYFSYGKFIERLVSPDDKETPAVLKHDGVDFIVLPHWKNMLIQLLNIAGVGPVIGVILGIKFGSIVFIILPIGNIIGGAVHDFLAGMISIRNGGANLPSVIEKNLGKSYYKIFSIFMTLLLLLVVAVFINIPAKLVCALLADHHIATGAWMFWICVAVIFIYYICATLFPVDKIIGKIYPFFGAMLLVGTLAMFIMIFLGLYDNPKLLSETPIFLEKSNLFKIDSPVIPVLFVTIACGIISGFHATQSPIIARTMKSERQAKSSFYGMMVLEGIIGMAWAAGGMAIYNLLPETLDFEPTKTLLAITDYFLGNYMSIITVLAVVILAITSGDTAMRSLRLSLAEIFSIDQKPIGKRFYITLPVIFVVCLLLWWSNTDAKSFGHLWNYFAWGNQILTTSTLFACAVWLFRQRKNGWVAILPAMFMSFIVISYILWVSPAHKGPFGFGLNLELSYFIAIVITLILSIVVYKRASARK